MKLSGLLLLVFMSFSVQAADPEWIRGVGHDEYRAAKYITALGEGESSGDARKNAISILAEQLKVSISSQSDIFKEYQSTLDGSSRKESMNIRIRTAVDLENVEGIKIVSSYFQQSSNTYFAFAVLDKVKNASNLSFKIEGQFELVRSQLEQVKKLLAKGESSEGIILLLKTSELFKDITKDIELHKLFSGSGMNSMLKSDAVSLISEFDSYQGKVFKRVNISVLSNHKAGSPELGVNEPYELTFKYNGQALKKVPVRLIAENSDTLLDADKTTNHRGELSVRVRSFPYSGKPEHKIKAQLDLQDEQFISRSPSVDLVILLSQKSEVSILLKTAISSRYNDYLYLTVNDGLSNVLSEQNYDVITEMDQGNGNVDYIIEVKATAVALPGFNGIHFTRMKGIVSIRSGKSGRALKTLRINSEKTKAGALSNDMAEEKSTALLVDSIKDELLHTLEKNLGRD